MFKRRNKDGVLTECPLKFCLAHVLVLRDSDVECVKVIMLHCCKVKTEILHLCKLNAY